jgi:hypothetical protein
MSSFASVVEAESLFARLAEKGEKVELITVVVFTVLADERGFVLVVHLDVAGILSFWGS